MLGLRIVITWLKIVLYSFADNEFAQNFAKLLLRFKSWQGSSPHAYSVLTEYEKGGDRPIFSLSEITAFRELFLECPHNKLLLDDPLYQLTVGWGENDYEILIMSLNPGT